jgi:hypothetical protein
VDGNCPEADIEWRLINEASAETLFDTPMQCNQPYGDDGFRLEGGDYTLTVYGDKGAIGAYRFALCVLAKCPQPSS